MKPTSYHLFALGLALSIAMTGCSDSPDEKPVDVDPDMGQTENASNNSGGDAGGDSAPGLIVAGVDLRADTNRDGDVSFDDDGDDVDEELWSPRGGAVFLPNIDDDDRSCNPALSDDALAACFDGADDALDGDADLLDLAPLHLRVFGDVPDEAVVTLNAEAGGELVRLFDLDSREHVSLPTVIAASELREPRRFGVEGKDVIRDGASDGRVTFTATVDWPEAPAALEKTDAVQMRSAPLILRHHLDPTVEVYSSELGIGGDGAFTNTLKAAVEAANITGGHTELQVEDQWAQDYFETAYVSMPAADGGQHIINVYIRSANLEQDFFGDIGLRPAGRAMYQRFHGPDAAAVTAVSRAGHSLDWDTLNSFGNTETIPPFTHEGKAWPTGRIIRGEGEGDRGDVAMRTLLEAQKVQDPLWVPTGWLFVSHIDETVSFIAAPETERGWVMLANDAGMALRMLQDAEGNGQGAARMFENKAWLNFRGREYAAETDIQTVLDDPDIMSANAEAIVEVDTQVNIIKTATGLTDAEIVPIPFLHMDVSGYSAAYQPGTVNGLAADASNFFAPETHGPVVDGVDIMKKAVEDELSPFGVTVRWVENWDMFHRLNGEVHCGSNVLRAAPTMRWWEVVE